MSASLLSNRVAQDFLQTVLIVDDRASLHLKDGPGLRSLALAGVEHQDEDRAQPTAEPSEDPVPSPGLVVPEDDELQVELHGDLDAKAIIDGFARLGLVCGVIRPEASETESISTVVNPAAMRSDVLVLDWWMHGDAGAASLEIIRELSDSTTEQHRVRLIIVYTAVPDLGQVAANIKGGIDNAELLAPNQVVAGGLRVVVLGKPETEVVEGLEGAVVSFADLPQRVIDEFARVVQGLVSNVALSSLAAVRNNTYRILTRFAKDLDPAYLGHRMLLLHPEDAEDHLVAVVVSELMAVLESTDVRNSAGIDAVKSMVDNDTLTVSDTGMFAQAAARMKIDPKELAVRLARYGAESTEAELVSTEKKNIHDWISGVYVVAGTSADNIDERFSVLMNSKLSYGVNAPQLHLGVILRDRSTGQFMLCMQPLCDSVRLPAVTDFPFLPLAFKENKCNIVVQYGDTFNRLYLQTKMRDLVIRGFRPTLNPPGVIKAKKDDDTGSWVFVPEGTTDVLDWVAELRDGFAHKYANVFADSASRVGVDESEWLRRIAK